MKRPQKISIAIFIVGLITALFGAFVMFHGSLFGDRNAGIAIVIGIVGMGLIAASNFRLLK